MKTNEKSQSQPRFRPLRPEELALVTGGEGGTAPRDVSTGQASGKRQH